MYNNTSDYNIAPASDSQNALAKKKKQGLKECWCRWVKATIAGPKLLKYCRGTV